LRLEEDLGVAQAETARLQAELAASQKDNLDMVAKVSSSNPSLCLEDLGKALRLDVHLDTPILLSQPACVADVT